MKQTFSLLHSSVILFLVIACGNETSSNNRGTEYGIKNIPNYWSNVYETIETPDPNCYEKWINPDSTTIPRYHSKWIKCSNIHSGNKSEVWFVQDNYIIKENDSLFMLGKLFDNMDDSTSSPLTYRLYRYPAEKASYEWFGPNAERIRDMQKTEGEKLLKKHGF